MDAKPAPRVQDSELLGELHRRWRECALCGEAGPLSLHHINRHPRDDVEGNLIMLCGHGTSGCHGLIEARDEEKEQELALYLRSSRADTLAYLDWRFPIERHNEWLKRVLGS